jgi:hypothetical protein
MNRVCAHVCMYVCMYVSTIAVMYEVLIEYCKCHSSPLPLLLPPLSQQCIFACKHVHPCQLLFFQRVTTCSPPSLSNELEYSLASFQRLKVAAANECNACLMDEGIICTDDIESGRSVSVGLIYLDGCNPREGR